MRVREAWNVQAGWTLSSLVWSADAETRLDGCALRACFVCGELWKSVLSGGASIPIPSRSFRLKELFSRLARHMPFSSLEEAYTALNSTLDAVEDELTGIENNPAAWKADGRMYPIQRDNFFDMPEHPGVTQLRSKSHYVYISRSGAIEISEVRSGVVVFLKPGADGRKVWDDE